MRMYTYIYELLVIHAFIISLFDFIISHTAVYSITFTLCINTCINIIISFLPIHSIVFNPNAILFRSFCYCYCLLRLF